MEKEVVKHHSIISPLEIIKQYKRLTTNYIISSRFLTDSDKIEYSRAYDNYDILLRSMSSLVLLKYKKGPTYTERVSNTFGTNIQKLINKDLELLAKSERYYNAIYTNANLKYTRVIRFLIIKFIRN